MTDKKWLVFYTKSRQEKKVYDFLVKRGFEVFLPVQQVLRQWSDRKKKVIVPLFNSYIFVFDTEARIPDIVQAPGIAWNVRHNNKPAVLHDHELEMIKRFLATGLFIETFVAEDLEEGDAVEVMDGPLRGTHGRVIHTPTGEKFSVTLEVLGSSMVVKLDSRLLKRV